MFSLHLQIVKTGQDVAFEYQGVKYLFKFAEVLIAKGKEQVHADRARLAMTSVMIFSNSGSQNPIKIINQKQMAGMDIETFKALKFVVFDHHI